MNSKLSKILEEIRSLFILIVIVLTLKVTIFELYIVPTGSMENTIMTGDFLAGNRFVYGMRTPEWIGIPYTDYGFYIPSLKFPSILFCPFEYHILNIPLTFPFFKYPFNSY